MQDNDKGNLDQAAKKCCYRVDGDVDDLLDLPDLDGQPDEAAHPRKF